MWGRLSNTLQLVQDKLEESLGEEKDESTSEQQETPSSPGKVRSSLVCPQCDKMSMTEQFGKSLLQSDVSELEEYERI